MRSPGPLTCSKQGQLKVRVSIRRKVAHLSRPLFWCSTTLLGCNSVPFPLVLLLCNSEKSLSLSSPCPPIRWLDSNNIPLNLLLMLNEPRSCSLSLYVMCLGPNYLSSLHSTCSGRSMCVLSWESQDWTQHSRCSFTSPKRE